MRLTVKQFNDHPKLMFTMNIDIYSSSELVEVLLFTVLTSLSATPCLVMTINVWVCPKMMCEFPYQNTNYKDGLRLPPCVANPISTIAPHDQLASSATARRPGMPFAELFLRGVLGAL